MKLLFLGCILLASQNLFAASSAAKCQYSFNPDQSVVEGTGFKTSAKVGVAGKFLKFSINNKEKKKEIKELLQGLVVTVDLMSIDSGNAIRDKNLREAFFSLLKNNAQAEVKVKSVTDKEIEAELSVNKVSKPIKFSYEIKDDKIEAKGVFDALEFAMTDAFSALKKRCGALHTGADGKSKTWSDFNLRVEAKLDKVCN